MKKLINILIACLLLLACQKESTPESLTPQIFVNEVQQLGSNTYFLSGSYDPVGKEIVSSATFHYGTTEAMEQSIVAKLSGRTATIILEGLEPGTTYYYCLEIGNGADFRRSEMRSFTTEGVIITAVLKNANLINAVEQQLGREFQKEANGQVSLSNEYNQRLVEMTTKLDVTDVGDPHICDDIYLFTNLRMLSCGGNGITTLNLHDNTALEELSCEGKEKFIKNEFGDDVGNGFDGVLINLILPQNASALKYMYIRGNMLTDLDVTNCPSLLELNCMWNSLRGLDVSKNLKLEKLWCNDNPLGNLNLTNNTKLTYLNNGACDLYELDLSKNKELTSIECANNHLKELNITMLPKLYYLECGGNSMTNIDISKNTLLERLSIYNSHITSIDLSNQPYLKEIDFNVHEFKSLDLSHQPMLERLLCQFGPLTELDLSHNSKLNFLECHGNQLTTLDLSHNPMIGWLTCFRNHLTELDVSMIDNNASILVGDQITMNEAPQTLTLYVNAVQYAHEPGTFIYYMDKYNTGNQDRVNVVLKE